MVMALMVLLGFGLLFMFASDESQGAGQSIESLIRQQSRDIEGYQSGITHGRKTLELAPARLTAAKDLTRFKRETQALEETITGLKTKVEAAKAAIVTTTNAWEAYKDEYRAYARGKAKGETMDQLETRTGTVYSNVNIREVTAVGIQIRHGEGQKRIPFEELPEAMQDRFQFDPKQKDALLAAEKATHSQLEADVAVANEIEGQKMDVQRQKDAEAAREKTMEDIAVKEGQIAALREEIRGLEGDMDRAAADAASARAAGRMHINKSGNISGNIRSKQTRISSLQSEVARMKSRL